MGKKIIKCCLSHNFCFCTGFFMAVFCFPLHGLDSNFYNKPLHSIIKLILFSNRGDKMATWKKLNLKSVTWMSLLAFFLLALSTAWAQEDSVDYWPQEIETKQGVVVVYQPQPEKLEGNKLSGLAAVSVEMKKLKAIWYSTKNATKKGCWKLNRANLCRL
jgi:hypothetical protein